MTDIAQPDIRTRPIALWRVARAFLVVLHDLFGAPEDVAARHTLTAAAHKMLASWIRAGEAMLRRLLLIEAAAVAAEIGDTHSPSRPCKFCGSRACECVSPRKRRTITHYPEQPEDWRVRFRCFSRDGLATHTRAAGAAKSAPAAPARVRRQKSAAARFRSAWPLAERYEAMLRVFNAPAQFARRLARRLAAAPGRVANLLRAPPEYAHRVDRAEELTQAAERCWGRRDTS